MALWVDVDQDAARVRAKYGVRFTPSVLFLDREGASLGEYEGAWETDALVAKVEETAARYRGPWARSTEVALERAREARRPVILVFWDDGAEKPQARVNAVLGDTITEYILCLRPFDEAAKKLVDTGRTWLVVDPLLEKPLQFPLARIAIPKEAKGEDIRAELRRAREQLEKSHPK